MCVCGCDDAAEVEDGSVASSCDSMEAVGGTMWRLQAQSCRCSQTDRHD